MNLTFTEDRNLLVASLTGRLDSVTSTQAQASLLEEIDKRSSHLILDLSDLEYLSSAGLRALLTAIKRVSILKQRSATVVKQPHIREILQISGFNTLVPSFSEQDEAKAALAP